MEAVSQAKEFDSMIYVCCIIYFFLVQHIMSRSVFIIWAVINGPRLSTMKLCFGGNGSPWHVILMFTRRECCYCESFCLQCFGERFWIYMCRWQWKLRCDKFHPTHTRWIPVPRSILLASDSRTCCFCSYKVSQRSWNHNSRSKTPRGIQHHLAFRATVICSQITRQAWFKDAVN